LELLGNGPPKRAVVPVVSFRACSTLISSNVSFFPYRLTLVPGPPLRYPDAKRAATAPTFRSIGFFAN
jgi:hypothetical protein